MEAQEHPSHHSDALEQHAMCWKSHRDAYCMVMLLSGAMTRAASSLLLHERTLFAVALGPTGTLPCDQGKR